jgi:protein tyrosine/serine phosphatase
MFNRHRASIAARHTAIAAVCAVSLLAANTAPAGLRRFLQINDHLYRGAQPTSTGLQSLVRLGVHAVIDLRGGGERSIAEEKAVEALGMKYYSVPLRPLAAPTDAQISTVLALIEDSENWPVFIHCERGRDRTGTVVACYRIRHDRWPNERALAEARDHGLSRIERGMRDFILHYQPAPAIEARQAGVETGSRR